MGELRGEQKGIQQFRSLLLKQLNARFPNQVHSHYLHLIEGADADKLSYWGEKLMTAKNIEEVFSCI